MTIFDVLKEVGVACVIIGIIAACFLPMSKPPEGNTTAGAQQTIEETVGRFTETRVGTNTTILTDTTTGVQYLWHKVGYGAGLTVLVDENGNPLIKEVAYENDK